MRLPSPWQERKRGWRPRAHPLHYLTVSSGYGSPVGEQSLPLLPQQSEHSAPGNMPSATLMMLRIIELLFAPKRRPDSRAETFIAIELIKTPFFTFPHDIAHSVPAHLDTMSKS